jgi:hypothetical protein
MTETNPNCGRASIDLLQRAGRGDGDAGCAACVTSAINVRPAGIGSQRWNPGGPDIGDSQVPSTRSAMAFRRLAAARLACTCRNKSPLWINRATTSAMIGEAIQPVARTALMARSRNCSGTVMVAIRKPGARHLAKLVM